MDEPALRGLMARLGVRGLVRSRGWLNGPCPLAPWTHSSGTDRHPSFGVKVDSQGVSAYWCWGCKNHGTIAALAGMLGHLRGEDYSGVARSATLADARWTFPEFGEVQREVEEPPEPLSWEAYGNIYPDVRNEPLAVDYLHGRGVGDRAIEALDLRWDDEDQRVVFPVYGQDGRLYGFTGRTVLAPEDYPPPVAGRRPYPKVKDYFGLRKRHLLLGENRVDPEATTMPVFLVEGLMGLASLFEQGADQIVQPVASMGANLSEEQATTLRLWNLPVVLALDADAGGEIGLWGPTDPMSGEHRGGGAVDKLWQHVVLRVPAWPEDKIDPDQLTLEDVRWMVETTNPYGH